MKKEYDLIRTPYLTEKIMILKEQQNKVAFKVDKNTTKQEIRLAIKSIFGCDVKKINMLNVSRKKKKQGRYTGYRSGWKKAIITLPENSKIEYFEGVS